jgi:hypothetical protein
MSLPLAIAVVVLADLVLIGLLAFVMSRAVRLTPHQSIVETRGAAEAWTGASAPAPAFVSPPAPASRHLRNPGRSGRRAPAGASSRS